MGCTGRYGATEGDDTFEVLLDEQNYRLEPQPVELVDVVDPKDTSQLLVLIEIMFLPKNYDHPPTKHLTTKIFLFHRRIC